MCRQMSDENALKTLQPQESDVKKFNKGVDAFVPNIWVSF